MPRQKTPTQNMSRMTPGITPISLQNVQTSEAAMVEAMAKMKMSERVPDGSLVGGTAMEQEAASSPPSLTV